MQFSCIVQNINDFVLRFSRKYQKKLFQIREKAFLSTTKIANILKLLKLCMSMLNYCVYNNKTIKYDQKFLVFRNNGTMTHHILLFSLFLEQMWIRKYIFQLMLPEYECAKVLIKWLDFSHLIFIFLYIKKRI